MWLLWISKIGKKKKPGHNGPLKRESIGNAFDMMFKYQFSKRIWVKIGLIDN